MDLERREQLEGLHDIIIEFMVYFTENEINEVEEREEKEYEFLKDESGVSNTDLDNLMIALQTADELIEKIK